MPVAVGSTPVTAIYQGSTLLANMRYASDQITVAVAPDPPTGLAVTVVDNLGPYGLSLENKINSLPEDTDTTSRTFLANIIFYDDGMGTNVLSVDNPSYFEIYQGDLYLVAGASLDQQTAASHWCTISVSDSSTKSSPSTIAYVLSVTTPFPSEPTNLSVQVVDNQGPDFIFVNALTTSLPEDTDTTNRILLAYLFVSDFDSMGTNVLSVDNPSYFEIFQGNLYLVAGATLDLTVAISHSCTITASDSSNNSPAATANYTLQIPDPYASSVSLLLQDSLYDESPEGHTLVISGNTALSTTQVKVGSRSIYFDDTGDRISTSYFSGAFAFGTGDYTVEAWVYIPPHATTRQVRLLSTTNSSSNFSFEILSTGAVRVWNGSNLLNFGGTAVTQGAWHHVAFCRASNVVRAFVDGNQIGSGISDSTNMINNQSVQIHSTNAYSGPACYLDALRVTKAARYTANFTPTTIAFPNPN